MPRKKICSTCLALEAQVKFLQGTVEKLISFQCPSPNGEAKEGEPVKSPLQKYENYIAEITGAPHDEAEMGIQRTQ